MENSTDSLCQINFTDAQAVLKKVRAVVSEEVSSAVAHSSTITQTPRYIPETKKGDKQGNERYIKNSE